MRNVFSTLLCLLLLATQCLAQTACGVDLLGLGGMPEQRVNQIIAAWPPGAALGAFRKVDGWKDATPYIEKFAASGKVPVIRVEGNWNDAHNYPNVEQLGRQTAEIEPLALRYPNTHFYLSGACEHKLNQAQTRQLYNATARACPHCTIINVPMTGAKLPDVINETHWNGSPPSRTYTVSMDGHDSTKSEVRSWKAHLPRSKIFLGHFHKFNGRAFMADKTPRAKRRAWPSVDEVLQVLRASCN